MTIIRQGSLFDLQELYDLEPTQRFEAIFSTIDIDSIFAVLTKKSRFVRPVELNYAAMIYSLIARITERIQFIKDLIKRLKNDIIFRLDSDFWYLIQFHLKQLIQELLQSLVNQMFLKERKKHFFNHYFSI
jgi:transposase